jgi:broad specificity phosphatase PhoE
MFAAALAARDRAEGREAVCVSHQMPIVCLRRYAEGRRLWHDPRHRQCSLASVTSLTFRGDTVVRVDYAEPAGRSSNLLSEQPPGA